MIAAEEEMPAEEEGGSYEEESYESEEGAAGDSVETSYEEEKGEFAHESEEDAHESEEGSYESEEAYEGHSDTELSKQIDKLIEEAKKRKVSETSDLHFLKFLNKTQVDSFNSLTNEEQEQVKLYISEKSYFTSSDVLRLISEALSTKNETLEERLIRLMPENIKPIWNQINESSKKSILSQARLYPDLNTESKVEHFWLTRNLKKNESVTKKLVSHSAIIQEDKLTDNEMTAILERFKSI